MGMGIFNQGAGNSVEDLLWPSVYEEDDEAYTIWRDKIGVPEEPHCKTR